MLRYIYSTLTIRHLCRISLTNRRFWMWQQKTLLFALYLTCFHQWFAADFVTCKLKHQQKYSLFGAKVENAQVHWLRSLILTTYLRNVRAYSLVKKKTNKQKNKQTKKRFKDLYNWTDFPSQLKLLRKKQQFLARSVQVKWRYIEVE